MLTPEQKAGFAAMYAEGDGEQEVSTDTSNEVTSQTGTDDAQAQASGTDDQSQAGENEGASSTESRSKDPIPYDRFSREVKKRRELERELQYMRGQLAAHNPQSQGPQGQEDWQDSQGEQQDPVMARLEKAELYMAEQKLDRLVANTRQASPHLTEDFIYRAVASGAKTPQDVQQAWTSLSALLGSHQGQAPQGAAPAPQQRTAQRPSAPPSVKPTNRVPTATMPKTLDEAKVAMKQYLATQYNK
jgi:hypothetical protein